MIVSDACIMNVSLALAFLALASVLNYAQFGVSLTDDSGVIVYDCNISIIQATVVKSPKRQESIQYIFLRL